MDNFFRSGSFADDLKVRTLLNDYLSDEEKGMTAGRNPISSINEILRESRFYRDRGKVYMI